MRCPGRRGIRLVVLPRLVVIVPIVIVLPIVELCAFGCQLRPSPIVMTGGGEFAPVGEGLEILGHHSHCVLATVVTDGAGAGRLEGWTLTSRVQRDRNRITIATDDRRQQVAV